jgi:hypothetical protein
MTGVLNTGKFPNTPERTTRAFIDWAIAAHDAGHELGTFAAFVRGSGRGHGRRGELNRDPSRSPTIEPRSHRNVKRMVGGDRPVHSRQSADVRFLARKHRVVVTACARVGPRSTGPENGGRACIANDFCLFTE